MTWLKKTLIGAGLGVFAALLVWLAAPTPVLAADWFLHEFGELRAYHGDWLAVCEDAGAGPCRAVFSAVDPGSAAYFDTRIALHRIDDSPDWAIEIMDRGVPARALTRLQLKIDGTIFDLPPAALRPGDIAGHAASDTVVLRDAELAARLVAAMRAGNRAELRYAPQGDGDGMARVSLRGVTAATRAIEARVLARQE